MSSMVNVEQMPPCDFASEGRCATQTMYDFKTIHGPWANGCGVHWRKYRAFSTLGTGKGQQLVTGSKKPSDLEALAAKYIEAVDEWNVISSREPDSDDDPISWLAWSESAQPALRVAVDLGRLFASKVGSESQHQANLLPIAEQIRRGEQL